QLLMIGLCGVAIGVGGAFIYTKKVVLPQQTRTIQKYEKKTNELEKELTRVKKESEGTSTGETPIPKHSYSHQEYVNLKAIGEQFSKSYYTLSTDTAEEKLKGLSKIVTPKLKGKLRPAWVDDYKNSIPIKQETISEQYYVKLNGVTGKATMIGCLLVSTKHGSAQAFDVKYIDKFTLEKDETNHWKINKFEEQIAPREFSESYFTQE
ncbi:hypothetical protein D929_01680, partial [Enterococcus faecalis 02-MB-P-10]|uniref:hypothetical protein n=1 Tax=Enterococcus faecalis TaxID=1351 RepID=UPI000353E361